MAGAVVLGALASPAASGAATFTVNSTLDPGIGTCDATECTLREAIDAANALGGTDTIAFNIVGVPSIKPLSQLPPITDPAIVDGTTQPGYTGSPIVELDGTLAPAVPTASTSSGLVVGPGGGGSTIRGLVINRFSPTINAQAGGIVLKNGADGNTIQGNYIGTDVTGTLPRGNANGIWAGFSNGNTIGGTTAAARNVIADNKAPNGAGIWAGQSNTIQGNYIGTNSMGTAALGNGYGVILDHRDNILGGTSAAARNVISGNVSGGIQICGACTGLASQATGNFVQGNYIGTDVNGTAALPNGSPGAVIVRSPSNTIGGTTAGAGNVISGNSGVGVALGISLGSAATDNLLQGNLIGTAADGTSPLGNGTGVRVGGGATTNLRNAIGGTAAAAGNTIAYNTGAGVVVDSTTSQNPILGNAIYANGTLGIDLIPNGVTPNDIGDADSGANDLQNFPVLSGASSSGGNTTVQGTLNSTGSTTFRIEFFSSPSCDPSGFGEGKKFLGSQNVSTDASGNATFTATMATATSPGQVVTATATDPDDNTSEFSSCELTPLGKVSARGTVQTEQGPSIGFSAVTNCDAAQSTRPSIVGTTSGALIWSKSAVTESECSDAPPTSSLGFDTQSGTATGTFGAGAPGGLSGQQGTLQWTYYDNGPDSVQFTLKDNSDTIVYQVDGQRPTSYRGASGGVWTFGP